MARQFHRRGTDSDSRDAVAAQFEAHRQAVFGFLRSRVGSPEHAEDLLQQVFVRLLQRADWKMVDNPQAYIQTTARHVLSDFYRHQGARDNGVVIDFEEFQHGDDSWAPGRAAHGQENLSRLVSVLESLSPNVRKSFVLSRIFGYTYAEIGQTLSISPRTVEKHVAKGLAWCFQELSDEISN